MPIICHLGSGTDATEAKALGFTAVMTAPFGPANAPVGARSGAEAASAVRAAAKGGLPVHCDLPWRTHAPGSALPAQQPAWFAPEASGDAIDPRGADQRGARRVLAERTELRGDIAGYIANRAKALADAGAAGIRLPDLAAGDASFWRAVVDAVRAAAPGLVVIGDGTGGPFGAVLSAEAAGFDFLMDSAAWWDGHADWFLDQRDALTTPTIGAPEGPDGDDLSERGYGGAHMAAARTARAVLTSTALMVPASLIERAGDDYRALLPDILAARANAAWLDERGLLRIAAKGLLRLDADPRYAKHALGLFAEDETGGLLAAAGGQMTPGELIGAGAATLMTLTARDRAKDAPRKEKASMKALEQLAGVRVAIEDPYPVIDGGRFPAKRIVGDTLAVGADVFADGHDQVAADLILTEAGQKPRRVGMTKGLNDRWGAEATLTTMGPASFEIEGWRDDYASWMSEITKKRAAGVDVSLEAIEGRDIVLRSLSQALNASLTEAESDLARATVDAIEAAGKETSRLLDATTNPGLAALLRTHGERPYASRIGPFPLTVDRRQARFSAWYELFPRSQSGTEDRHGTFDDVITRLPYVADLGFDVLYFPPIHPIGQTNRKGKNNSLKAEPGDVGSPYAIGSEDGGYKAVHPELGTLDDFGRLVAEAAKHGLEIALDIALNCSPDHPWIKEHPEWFEHRPDGSIKFAENPPKKYEDIVNLAYYGDAIPDLWQELRDTFLFWCEHGVRMYRIDNPHTKPYPLWEWLIAEVKAAYPDALFLSEAFTRPKVMARLAKLGFTQSYTYFTWRNTKHEMESYVRELNTAPLRDVMNPNFFVNTPDINPIPLQTNNRCAHVARTVLAGTLSASWGLYNGIEIVESTVLPGKEEYLDSEKYQIRAWDMDRPGHIKDDIRLVNRLRRRHPAMQEHGTVRLFQAWNDQVIWYAKRTPDLRDYLLFAVTFD